MATPLTPTLADYQNGGSAWTVDLTDGTAPAKGTSVTIGVEGPAGVPVTIDGVTKNWEYRSDTADLFLSEGSGAAEQTSMITMIKATYDEGNKPTVYKSIFANVLLGDPEEGGVWGSETEGG